MRRSPKPIDGINEFLMNLLATVHGPSTHNKTTIGAEISLTADSLHALDGRPDLEGIAHNEWIAGGHMETIGFPIVDPSENGASAFPGASSSPEGEKL